MPATPGRLTSSAVRGFAARLAAVAVVGLALWLMATTVATLGSARIVGVYNDLWRMLDIYRSVGWGPALLTRSNAHPMSTSVLLFWGAARFSGLALGPYLVAYQLVLATLVAIAVGFAVRAPGQPLTRRAAGAATLVALACWPSTWVSYSFLNELGVILPCYVGLALVAYAVARRARHDARGGPGPSPRGTLLVGLAGATLATLSFGTGLGVWPALVVTLVVARAGPRWFGGAALAGALAFAAVFLGFDRDPWVLINAPTSAEGSLSTTLSRPFALAESVYALLGLTAREALKAQWTGSWPHRTLARAGLVIGGHDPRLLVPAAAALGALGMILLLRLASAVWRGAVRDPARAQVGLFLALVGGAACSAIAFGRIVDNTGTFELARFGVWANLLWFGLVLGELGLPPSARPENLPLACLLACLVLVAPVSPSRRSFDSFREERSAMAIRLALGETNPYRLTRIVVAPVPMIRHTLPWIQTNGWTGFHGVPPRVLGPSEAPRPLAAGQLDVSPGHGPLDRVWACFPALPAGTAWVALVSGDRPPQAVVTPIAGATPTDTWTRGFVVRGATPNGWVPYDVAGRPL